MNLNQECMMLQSELRNFAQQVILDRVDEFDKSCSMPADGIKQLAEMGILGAIIPEDMGGAELNLMGLTVSLEELSKVCPSTAMIIAAHNAFFAYPILKFGSDEMKEKYLPPAATGGTIAGFALTQTNNIKVEKKDEGVVLSGKNPFVLNAETKGPFTMFVTDEIDNKKVIPLIVDNDIQGIKGDKNTGILGLRSAGICELTFDNAVVPINNIIGKENNGAVIAQASDDFARVCFAAIALGILQGATDAAVKYAKERVQFNQQIIKFGMIREKVAELTIRTEAARQLTYDAAMQHDAGKNYRRAAAIAKYYAGRSAVEITTQAIQIYGGYGYMKDYPVERYFRDAQVINVLCAAPVDERENIVKETIG